MNKRLTLCVMSLVLVSCAETSTNSTISKTFKGSCCVNGTFYDCPSEEAMQGCDHGDLSACVRSAQGDKSCEAPIREGRATTEVSVDGAVAAKSSVGGCHFPRETVELNYVVDSSLGEVKIENATDNRHSLDYVLFYDDDTSTTYDFAMSYDDVKKTGTCELKKPDSCRVFAELNGKPYVQGKCPRFPRVLIAPKSTTKISLNGKQVQ